MAQADEVRFGLWYDFRNPPQWEVPSADLYAHALDQIAWAETLGYGSIWLTQHSFTQDGYTPSPLIVSSAIAMRTSEMYLGQSLLLLPLLDPIRTAEDAATLAILSQGRFSLGFGLGYRDIEFEAFGRSLKHRPSLMEEGVDIIRRALAGESLKTDGKRYQLPDVKISPVPAPEHRPPILLGGMAEPAIERCARLGDGFLSTQNDHQPMYLDACAKLGKEPGPIHAGQWVIIDEDPEKTWSEISQHALYQINEYISWGAFGPPDQVPQFPDADALIAGGAFTLWDGPTAVSELTKLLKERPMIKDVYFWAQLPGEAVDHGSQRMQFFASEVAPKVREGLA